MDEGRIRVIRKGAFVCSKHQGCCMRAHAKDLNDTFSTCSFWHISVSRELPNSYRKIITLKNRIGNLLLKYWCFCKTTRPCIICILFDVKHINKSLLTSTVVIKWS